MSLRYEGKPFVGANRQADKLPELCLCEFVAVGVALDGRKCLVHGTRRYRCDVANCGCLNYRPNKPKKSPARFPLCSCGHIAQEHN